MNKSVSNKQLHEIKEAIEKLGYSKKVITVKPIDSNRTEVKVGGEPFGIYDFVKHTFVD